MSNSAYYALFAIIAGPTVGWFTLRILQYPDRYPTIVMFLFFPATIGMEMQDSDARPDVTRVLWDDRFHMYMGTLLALAEIDQYNIKRGWRTEWLIWGMYCLLTTLLLPIRLSWVAVLIPISALLNLPRICREAWGLVRRLRPE